MRQHLLVNCQIDRCTAQRANNMWQVKENKQSENVIIAELVVVFIAANNSVFTKAIISW